MEKKTACYVIPTYQIFMLFYVEMYLTWFCNLNKSRHTVKPFDLAALKVGDLACKIILAPFILVN